jgi:hypothetical protein
MTFAYLNRQGEQLSTHTSNTTLFNFLEESEDNKQKKNIIKKSPRLIFASHETLSLFSSDSSHVGGVTIPYDGSILISIDNTRNCENLLISIIHEIQHLYNSYYINDAQNYTLNELSTDIINKFIQFIDSTVKPEFKNKSDLSLINNFQKIIMNITQYENKDRHLNELSAHLTSLLFHYDEVHIRSFIDILMIIAEATCNHDYDDLVLISNVISNAFSYIEQALHHLSSALRQFISVNTIEFLNNNFENDTDFDEARFEASKTLRFPADEASWDEIIDDISGFQTGNEYLLEAATYKSSIHSLLEQAKTGNNKLIATLLQINKSHLNNIDHSGCSPIIYTIINNHISTFNLLLQFGAALNWIGKIDGVNNCSLLHLAARYGRFEFIPILLNHGLNPTLLNSKYETPLLCLAKYISSKDYTDNLLNCADKNTLYNKSITALACLLSHNNELDIRQKENLETQFYNALVKFRKNIAILYTLHTSDAFRIQLPDDIILTISFNLDETVICEAYRHCYKDIMRELITNKYRFNTFLKLGIQSAYHEFNLVIQNNINPIHALKIKFFDIIPLDALLTPSLLPIPSQEEVKHLSDYYSPRSLQSGVTSLAAITFAQKQMRENPSKSFFQEDKYKERRLLISQWKDKVDRNDDEELSLAILQACKEIGIAEINTPTYHKFAAILNKLVIKDNKTPKNYTPQMFVQEFKNSYQESLSTTDVKFKR